MVLEGLLVGLVNSLFYLGVFAGSLIVSASIFFPLPGILIIIAAAALGLNPFLVSLMSASGSMIGELTGYYAGFLGNKITAKAVIKYRKVVRRLEDFFHKYAFMTILVTSFLPFPFDLVGIIAGISRYSIPKFLFAGFVGKFFKTLLLYWGVLYTIPYITEFVQVLYQ